MFSRRGFIRIGTATVGSLALRPFRYAAGRWRKAGRIIGRWYAFFCSGGNDCKQHRDPDGRCQLQRLSVDSRKPGFKWRQSDNGHERVGRALCVSFQACRSGQVIFQQRTGCGGEHRLTGATVDKDAVSESAGSDPAESFFTFRSAALVADFGRAGTQRYGMGRTSKPTTSPRKTWRILPPFPRSSQCWRGMRFRGRESLTTQPVALSPGQSLQLTGFNSSAASTARL